MERWSASQKLGKKRAKPKGLNKHDLEELVDQATLESERHIESPGTISSHVLDDFIYKNGEEYYIIRRTPLKKLKLTWESIKKVLDYDGIYGLNGGKKDGMQLDGITISTSGHALGMPIGINHDGVGPHAVIMDPYSHMHGEFSPLPSPPPTLPSEMLRCCVTFVLSTKQISYGPPKSLSSILWLFTKPMIPRTQLTGILFGSYRRAYRV